MNNTDLLITGISELATPGALGPRRGAEMAELSIIPNATIAVAGGLITYAGPSDGWHGDAQREVDADGCAVIPALVDPHTHAVWGGNRFADFEARSAGVSYEEILASGGGIRSTVSATGRASVDELVESAIPRIEALMVSGAATIEVKSGYGFDPEVELRSLEVISRLTAQVPARIIPTLLIHLPPEDPSERDNYLDMVTSELIPEVASRELADAVDIFIEKEAFSAKDAERVFGAALSSGLPVKAHADQFHTIGGVESCVAHDALSIDHLEASTGVEIELLAHSNTIATILPGVTLHLGIGAAPGRRLIDAGAMVAVGTDLNPGSSPLFSTQQAMALSVRLNGLAPAEALTAATVNAAAALGLKDSGAIVPGARADLLILNDADWRTTAWTLGASVPEKQFIAGIEICHD